MIRLLTLLVAFVATLAGLGPQLAPFVTAGVTVVPASRAWFDSPLPGASVPRAALAVVGHATDPDGVASLELAVDGVVVAEEAGVDAGDGTMILARARLRWREPTPGRHLLTLTGIDQGGQRGYPARLVVEVSRRRPTATATPRPTARPTPRPTPRATPRPTPRPTPRRTPRPTPTPCVPPPPRLASPADFFLVSTPADNPPVFRWGYAREPSCQPTGYVLDVRDEDGAVVLRRRLRGDVRRFRPGSELADCHVYRWRVRAVGSGGTGRASPARSLAVSYRCG